MNKYEQKLKDKDLLDTITTNIQDKMGFKVKKNGDLVAGIEVVWATRITNKGKIQRKWTDELKKEATWAIAMTILDGICLKK